MSSFLTEVSIWMFLSIFATIIAFSFKTPIALAEIIIGMIAYQVLYLSNYPLVNPEADWTKSLAEMGALSLNFLAGLELNSTAIKENWKETGIIGLISFLVPFSMCFLFAHYGLEWSLQASLLAGIALSTTSVAVVYAILLESGLNSVALGKSILSIALVTDLLSMSALFFIFFPSPSTLNLYFIISLIVFFILPIICKITFRYLGDKPFEFEVKFIFLCLFILSAVATFAGSEAVVFSYFLGISLANIFSNKSIVIKNLRVIIFGLLAPFCFIKAGMLISVPILFAAPLVIVTFFSLKIIAKTLGVYLAIRAFRHSKKQSMYTALLLSPGLALGSTATLLGLFHHIINNTQYSIIITAVLLSSFIPVTLANIFCFPKHLLGFVREKIN